jgi:D-alanine--poly(phosphoribitol) ligase subunit 2
MVAQGGLADAVLGILAEVTETEKVRKDLDLPLYGSGVLDSLGTVSLLVALERDLGLSISPADLDPTAWATPRLVIADVERRLAGK